MNTCMPHAKIQVLCKIETTSTGLLRGLSQHGAPEHLDIQAVRGRRLSVILVCHSGSQTVVPQVVSQLWGTKWP